MKALLILCIVHTAFTARAFCDEARPMGEMKTRWAAQINPDKPLPEHPRPSLVRDSWTNLNGRWDYAITGKEAPLPSAWDGRIIVPFAVESQLSGVQRTVGSGQRLWYARDFAAPAASGGDRLLLHFGAVDWECWVTVNGKEVGRHQGGFDPFTFDITDAVKPGADNRLVVSVWDPTDEGSQPRGKQVRKPEGIFYTAVTGIWQTVWLETVPAVHITHLRASGDPATGMARIQMTLNGASNEEIDVKLLDKGNVVAETKRKFSGQESTLEMKLEEAKPWTPDSPHLYDLKVTLGKDIVRSYVAFRTVGWGPDEQGIQRLLLNGKPIFHFGPLDQGWWPDGLYTAPTDEALRFDIEETRAMGFNAARKHIKVEPARWYYWADKLGLMVWQDMPSGFASGRGQAIRAGTPADAVFNDAEKAVFRHELKVMMNHLAFHPCIVAWIPFNEGWGQHDTNALLREVKQMDPTRIVGGPSGWEDRGFGDMKDMHNYPGPDMFPVLPDRVSVLGEFGGLGWPKEGHLWWNKRNWGYRTYQTQAELHAAYEVLIGKLKRLVPQGLAAAIYTQTTDVEGEVNGLLTYDRVRKFDPAVLKEMHASLFNPAATKTGTPILATAESGAGSWRYSTTPPAPGWELPDHDDSKWLEGKGGFGSTGTPQANIGTEWTSRDIWLRRGFELTETPAGPVILRIHHDEDTAIHLNGQPLARLAGFSKGYFEIELAPEKSKLLRKGHNVIAIHCHQTVGGQFIDAGLYPAISDPAK